MALIGARIVRLIPGECDIELPFRADLTQQHGFFHGGVTAMIADSAGGYAGFSLYPTNSSVLTVEFKMNLVAPAAGELLIATGRVLRPGRTLFATSLEVAAIKGGRRTVCAHGLQTLMCLAGRPDRRA